MIREYVNNKQAEINHAILKSSPSLLSFIEKDKEIQWHSPLKDCGYKEYRNEFLNCDDNWTHYMDKMDKYWPKIGPSWDGIATVEGKDGRRGLLLVEAKAHVREMNSQLRASDDKSIELILRTIQETKSFFGSEAPIDTWVKHYYQLANRFAYLYLMNEKFNIPTWLVLVNFVNDVSHKPTTIDEWLNHYKKVFTELDIKPSSSRMLSHLITVFPEGKEET
ncbi:hypothetical protein LF817_00670 [Halobacillus sp. A1]|uniref:hypothetical protein n=1 Tax=Halobacillus sp. A1 TaxID=2880262 RepID=UPI0020A69FD9|nr:hypothetical protein [Halobacillus sp. A1]MCP3029845.1 hypothetical protein [Halobacillus sp. A1]